MCCLFGIINGGEIPYTLRKNLVKSLSLSAMDRGIDATGISYFNGGKLAIDKINKPADKCKLKFPKSAYTITGHTRLTTQGDNSKIYNLHPFPGHNVEDFALAHNGVISNYYRLKHNENLPETRVETDSYIAIQLLESMPGLTGQNIAKMCEKLQGTFCFSILARDRAYLVKGNNPLCVYFLTEYNAYIYASTEEILHYAISPFELGVKEIDIPPYTVVEIPCMGGLIKTEINHALKYDFFQYDGFYDGFYGDSYYNNEETEDNEWLEYLSSLAKIPFSAVEMWKKNGYSVAEIETILEDATERRY